MRSGIHHDGALTHDEMAHLDPSISSCLREEPLAAGTFNVAGTMVSRDSSDVGQWPVEISIPTIHFAHFLAGLNDLSDTPEVPRRLSLNLNFTIASQSMFQMGTDFCSLQHLCSKRQLKDAPTPRVGSLNFISSHKTFATLLITDVDGFMWELDQPVDLLSNASATI